MNIAKKTILITGANRGIGQPLVEEALRRGAQRVYAGTRGPLQHSDKRVTPLTLDVTSVAQIQRAVSDIDALDVLINNAGISIYDDLSKPEVIEQHLAVNLFGPLNVARACLPLLKRSKGAIVNNISTVALAALPIVPGYSISKAASLSMTQSLRALLAGQGVAVHAVLTGPVDTDMNRDFDYPKASPESAAVGIFDGMEKGEEEIFPDPSPNPSPRAGATAQPRPSNECRGFRPGKRGSLKGPRMEMSPRTNHRPNPTNGEKDDDATDGNNDSDGNGQGERQGTRERASRDEHTSDRVAAGVGGCAPAAPREGEGLDPLP